MPRNVSSKEKLQAVKEYQSGKGSYKVISEKYGVAEKSLRKWLVKYKAFGESAFIESRPKAIYSSAFKRKVIKEYVARKRSLVQIAIKYKIPDLDTVRRWYLEYNSHEKKKKSGKGGKSIMAKGRKTTFEERLEIVEYCIAHAHNYTETAEKYQISYQQARKYTIKYETQGVEGLRDNRGRTKPVEEMTEVEKLRAENKLLKAEKARAEMEVSFLKKLAEIERRRG